jgi:hypothetical protein
VRRRTRRLAEGRPPRRADLSLAPRAREWAILRWAQLVGLVRRQEARREEHPLLQENWVRAELEVVSWSTSEQRRTSESFALEDRRAASARARQLVVSGEAQRADVRGTARLTHGHDRPGGRAVWDLGGYELVED